MTLVRGGHQYAFGANVAGWTSLSLANVRSPGQLAIDGTQTGLPLSDFMLGRMGVNALIQAAPNTLDMKQTYLGLYAQDTWRAGSRVTVNYGLRWEPFFPQQLQNGAVYQFDQGRFNQGIRSTVFPKGPAGLYFPGDPGFPSKAGMETQWGNLGPRVGVAYDPGGEGKTSIRASFGRSFEFVNAQFHLNTSVAPPWGSEVRINAPIGGLDNPFINTSGQTNIFPVTFDQNAPFSLNGPFLSLSRDGGGARGPVERDGRAPAEPVVIVTAGYLSGRTSNIWSRRLNNAVFQNVGAAPPSVANINARRPFTLQNPAQGQFYGPVDLYVTDGKQRYDGMIVSGRRIGSTWTMAANYALSHCHGSPDGFGGATTNVSSGYNKPEDPGYDDGNCTSDRLHNFTATGSVMSPRLENSTARAILSNWQLVGSFRALTGSWLTVLTGVDRVLNGQAGTQRANQISDDVYGNQSVNPTTGAIQFLNPAAFAQPALGTFGNVVRNSIRGPGSKNLDLALTRAFPFSNAHALEIRIETFNAFNWFVWGNPNVAVNAATFGQITSTSGTVQPRIMQFALKYTF